MNIEYEYSNVYIKAWYGKEDYNYHKLNIQRYIVEQLQPELNEIMNKRNAIIQAKLLETQRIHKEIDAIMHMHFVISEMMQQ